MATAGDGYFTAEIHAASGAVAVQTDCSSAEALALMIERALDVRCTLGELAAAIVDRSVTFDD